MTDILDQNDHWLFDDLTFKQRRLLSWLAFYIYDNQYGEQIHWIKTLQHEPFARIREGKENGAWRHFPEPISATDMKALSDEQYLALNEVRENYYEASLRHSVLGKYNDYMKPFPDLEPNQKRLIIILLEESASGNAAEEIVAIDERQRRWQLQYGHGANSFRLIGDPPESDQPMSSQTVWLDCPFNDIDLDTISDGGYIRFASGSSRRFAVTKKAKDDYLEGVESVLANKLLRTEGSIAQQRKWAKLLSNKKLLTLDSRGSPAVDAELKYRYEIGQINTESQVRMNALDRLNMKKVFIVHGHNNEAKHAVARFVDKLGLEPIILHELPNRSRTIIEKFEEYSDVAFAIILLTADDRGGPKNTPFEDQKWRARQNVIMELGYFIGRLGRERVCALHEGSVEKPSDYDGVLFVKYDADDKWHLELARELKAADLDVDLNNAV